MNKPNNGEQRSVTVSIFDLLFMRTDVMLQVLFMHKKRIDTCTLGVLKSTDSSRNQVQLNKQKRTVHQTTVQ